MQPAAASITEVAHLLGGAALALAFALLARRRLGAMVLAVRVQSAIVAAAAAVQAWALGSAAAGGLAAVLLAGGTAVLPWALRRGGKTMPETADDTPAALAAMVVAAGVVILAMLSVPLAHLPGLPMLREDLALALATVLQALLILATRRSALPQLVGLQALVNGVALVALVVGAPMAATLGVLALFGFVAVGLAVQPAAGDAP